MNSDIMYTPGQTITSYNLVKNHAMLLSLDQFESCQYIYQQEYVNNFDISVTTATITLMKNTDP